jgi:Fe-S-cluster containining protein
MIHPCQHCGACCASFRVAFHWMETEPSMEGRVPAAFTEKFGLHRVAMRGTQTYAPRCVALQGEVGDEVRCSIYAQRPSVCRDLQAAWEHGEPSAQCDKARKRYGLPPLTPDDWEACSRPALNA